MSMTEMSNVSESIDIEEEEGAGRESEQETVTDGERQHTAADLSQLRKPIELGRSDVRQLINCLKDGTEDVRSTLLDKCKLIYECKVCSSLFRGLPNFLAHKRVFCMNTEPAESYLLGGSLPDMTTVFVEPHGSDSEDEIDAIPQPKASDMYKSVERKLQFSRDNHKEAVIKLERIDSNSKAVHQQSIRRPQAGGVRPNNTDHGSRAVQLGQHHQSALSKLLKSPSKSRRSSLVKAQTILQNLECKEMFKHLDFCNVTQLRCLRCDITYGSFKSLKRHMFAKHKESSAAANFHCPKCKSPFSKFWNLTRHLLKRHKISAKELENFKQKTQDMRMKITASFHAKIRNLSSQDRTELGELHKEADVPREPVAASLEPGASPVSSALSDTVITKPETSGISFQQGFSLLKCATCSKVFGKQESYEKHVEVCDAEISFRSVPGSPSEPGNHDNAVDLCMECTSEGEDQDKEKSMSNKSLAKATHTSPGPVSKTNAAQPKATTNGLAGLEMTSKTGISPKINKRELREVRQIINRQENRCNRCGLRSKDPTSLYHHAITHLGWQQYKCKRCSYMSYNVADCKNHIRRGHPLWCAGKTDLASFMVIVPKDTRVPASRGSGQRANLRNVIICPKKLDI